MKPTGIGEMRLFHFSDDPAIQCFTPRPVAVAAERALGMDWLNGPLVWAIDDERQPMYLFPRDCPRILLWPEADTTEPGSPLVGQLRKNTYAARPPIQLG